MARPFRFAVQHESFDDPEQVRVQVVRVGDDVAEAIRTTAEQLGSTNALVEQTPFVLIGSVQQIVDKLERLRADLGISHVVVRDAEGFAPVVDALTGR